MLCLVNFVGCMIYIGGVFGSFFGVLENWITFKNIKNNDMWVCQRRIVGGISISSGSLWLDFLSFWGTVSPLLI